MKKIAYELETVNDLLNSRLLVVNTTRNLYTIYKDDSRTHIINANLNRLEVIEVLRTIRELNYQGIIN